MTSRDKSPRHHRRKRLLVYRPSPNDFLKTPPLPPARSDMSAPQDLPRTLHLASPMEREKKRILSVELRDIAQEVEPLQVKTPPCARTSGANDRPVCNRLSSAGFSKDLVNQSSAVLPISTQEPSHTLPTCQPSLLPPKEESGWGLVPLFNSVRSKLESFAEIFITPVKSRRVAQNSEEGAPNQLACAVSGEVSTVTVQPSPLSPEHLGVNPEECVLKDLSSVLPHEEDTTEDNPSTAHLQRTPPNLRLQTGTRQAPSILCRAPLQRYLSCPLQPLTWHKRRHSQDTMEHPTEPCTCRRRRHSLGSVEECRNLSLSPSSLSCLRKENHPSVLRQSLYHPGDVWKPSNGSVHNEGSPASLYLDSDREQGLSTAEDQVTKESLPDSDFKSPENLSCSKENKVSTIQIRKRALRQEGKLTPLGLPKRVRLQKEDFSLEEIYTNKNYHTPTEKRKFETIFEEPVMKGGTLILTSQRPLRRIMIFKDRGSAPRKRKKKGKAAGRTRRYTAASTKEAINYELLLQQKLKQLEAALQEDMSEP